LNCNNDLFFHKAEHAVTTETDITAFEAFVEQVLTVQLALPSDTGQYFHTP